MLCGDDAGFLVEPGRAAAVIPQAMLASDDAAEHFVFTFTRPSDESFEFAEHGSHRDSWLVLLVEFVQVFDSAWPARRDGATGERNQTSSILGEIGREVQDLLVWIRGKVTTLVQLDQ